jgi:hypothetical protein
VDEPKVQELIKNQILWCMNVYFPNGRTIIHLFPPLKCTLPMLIPLSHWIQISFLFTVHVDGMDRDICLVFRNVIQDASVGMSISRSFDLTRLLRIYPFQDLQVGLLIGREYDFPALSQVSILS